MSLDCDFIMSKSRGVIITDKIDSIYSWSFYPKLNKIFITKRELVEGKKSYTIVKTIDTVIRQRSKGKALLELVQTHYEELKKNG